MRLFYYIKRFWEISKTEKLLFLKCSVQLPIVKLLVFLAPLKYYLFLIKTEPKECIPENEREYAIKIALKSLRRVTKLLQLRCNCMVKSISLKLLLNSLGICSNITLSIYKSDDSFLNAHAFLKITNDRSYLENKYFHEVLTIS